MAALLTIDNAPPCGSDASQNIYRNLTNASTNIRILDLHPGEFEDGLHCNLRIVSLHDEPTYEAVSYTWGNPLPDEDGHTNSKRNRIRIRPNLKSALRHLRQRKGIRTLWIDAICINQDNGEEKALQIGIMGEIYRSATTVLIWLGGYPGATLDDAHNTREPHWNTQVFSGRRKLNSRGRKFAEALEATLASATVKWQDRAWIIQEYVLAKQPMLCFGHICVKFEKQHLQDLTEVLERQMTTLMAFYYRISDLYRTTVVLQKEKSIHAILPHVCMASCWLPQDKVYSILSLIDEREAKMIPLDHGQLVGELFARATVASIVVQGSLTVLELVGLGASREYNLPSWAVDFTVKDLPIYDLNVPGRSCYVKWEEHCPTEKLFARISEDAKVLTVSGFRFSAVEHTLLAPSTSMERSASVTRPFAASLWSLLLRLRMTHYPNLESISREQEVESAQRNELGRLDGMALASIISAAFAVWDDYTQLAGGTTGPEYRTFSQLSDNDMWKRLWAVDEDVNLAEYAERHSGTFKVIAAENGHLAIAAANVEVGDHIVFLVNSPLPIILRARGSEFLFRGFAWVHNMMRGEAAKFVSSRESEDFSIA